MILIKKVTSAITAPARATGAVAGHALDLAVSGVRSIARLVNGAVRSGDDDRAVAEVSPLRPPTPATAPATEVTVTEPSTRKTAVKPTAKKAPAKKSAAKKASGKKPAAKKAPSARAATAGPAVAAARKPKAPKPPAGNDEPLLDEATAKAVRSEADVLRKAADPDKG